jgi:hypothetical protein
MVSSSTAVAWGNNARRIGRRKAPVRSALPASEPSHRITPIHAIGKADKARLIIATLYR